MFIFRMFFTLRGWEWFFLELLTGRFLGEPKTVLLILKHPFGIFIFMSL